MVKNRWLIELEFRSRVPTCYRLGLIPGEEGYYYKDDEDPLSVSGYRLMDRLLAKERVRAEERRRAISRVIEAKIRNL